MQKKQLPTNLMTPERIPTAFYIWLHLSDKDNIFFKSVQKKLRKNIPSVSFPIHLTISMPILGDEKVIGREFLRLRNVFTSFRIETNGCGQSNEFFESFFIKIKQSQRLLTMHNSLNRIFAAHDDGRIFSPHISLVYGDFSEEIKHDLIESLPEIPKILNISTISLAHANEAILEYKIINSFGLLPERLSND